MIRTFFAAFGAGVALWIVGVWAVVNYRRWEVAGGGGRWDV